MPFVGHLPELVLLMVLALIFLGPKRMIEMGSSAGKMLRDLRQQLKEVRDASGVTNLDSLLNPEEPRQTPFSVASQFSQSVGAELRDTPPPAAAPEGYTSATGANGLAPTNGASPIVEGTLGSTGSTGSTGAVPSPPTE
ncbi:MAG TPA: twin-arginine translocase TatA/TatE family subunit [Ktedonobacterales bacterium]|jgi:Sec-independent protein translocase protein TatA